MVLAVDVGNTHTNLAFFEGREIGRHWTLSTVLHRTTDEYLVLLECLLGMDKIAHGDCEGVVIASVVPPMTSTWAELAERLVGRDEILVVGPDTPIGMENRYESPRDVGADRLANAVAAKTLLGTPAIVVDFGTATTLDVISADGAYLGGAILAGPEMAAEALYAKTARLPSVFVTDPGRAIGHSTDQSIQSGIFYGTVGAIDSLIERIQGELGRRCRVIATGGAAPPFVAASRYIENYDAFLTLKGLSEIWRMNRGKG